MIESEFNCRIMFVVMIPMAYSHPPECGGHSKYLDTKQSQSLTVDYQLGKRKEEN